MYEPCLSSYWIKLVLGSTDGTVHVWNTDKGASTAVLKTNYTHPIHCVQFNPKYMMLVSASTTMVI